MQATDAGVLHARTHHDDRMEWMDRRFLVVAYSGCYRQSIPTAPHANPFNSCFSLCKFIYRLRLMSATSAVEVADAAKQTREIGESHTAEGGVES